MLKILEHFGGQVNRMDVLKELEIVMEDQLTDFDKSDIQSGSIRWEIRVMREDKLLKPVSEIPRGVWALTGMIDSAILSQKN